MAADACFQKVGALLMRIKRRVLDGITIAVLAAASIAMAFPFIWMFITSFKSFDQVFIYPPKFIPDTFRWSNYVDAWTSVPFGRFFFNSIFTTLMIIFFQIVSSVLAAYAFARLQFKGKQLFFLVVLATMMIPIQVTFIPNFLIIKQFGWFDTYWGLIVPFSANAFGIFLIRQAFLQVPKDLEEAAKLDGCHHLQIIRHVMMPLSSASIITFTLFSFIWHYNDFFWPLITTNSDDLRTLQVGLSSMITQEGGESGTQWNLIMAASSIIIVPLLILFIMVQKFIVKGVATTGMK